MKNFTFAMSLFTCGLFAVNALAKPTAAQENLARHLEMGIDWAKHLRTEASKGQDLQIAHVEKEISGIKDALVAMETAQDRIIHTAPSKDLDHNLNEIRRNISQASAALQDYKFAMQSPKPNYAAMKSAAHKVLDNLEEAQHAHSLELLESKDDQRN